MHQNISFPARTDTILVTLWRVTSFILYCIVLYFQMKELDNFLWRAYRRSQVVQWMQVHPWARREKNFRAEFMEVSCKCIPRGQECAPRRGSHILSVDGEGCGV